MPSKASVSSATTVLTGFLYHKLAKVNSGPFLEERHMWRFQLLAISMILSLGSTIEAEAQQVSVQYGSDTRPIGPSECIRRAKADIRARGWPFTVTGNSTIVHGTRSLLAIGPNVSVLVDCVILGLGNNTKVRILVAASSLDDQVAERIRNEVRTAVMR